MFADLENIKITTQFRGENPSVTILKYYYEIYYARDIYLQTLLK